MRNRKISWKIVLAAVSIALFLKERMEKIFTRRNVEVFLGFLGRSLCSFLCLVLNWFYSPREREREREIGLLEMLIFDLSKKRKEKTDA